MRADKRLENAAATYRERNALYGDTYKHHGPVLSALFPKGTALLTPEDHVRFGLLTQIAGKLTRYAANFGRGGHEDSIHDLGVYAYMLEEVDAEVRQQENEA